MEIKATNFQKLSLSFKNYKNLATSLQLLSEAGKLLFPMYLALGLRAPIILAVLHFQAVLDSSEMQ